MARVHGAHTTVHHTPPHLACALLRVVARPPCYCTYYTTGGLPRVLLSATYYLLLTTYYTAGGLPRACHLRSHLSAARMCQGLGLRRRLRPLARTHALLRRRPLLLRPVRGRPYTHITYAYMCVYACTRSRGINARCGAYTPCDVPGRAGAGRPLHPPAQRGTPCSRATELQCAAALRVGLLSYSLRPNTTCYSSRTAHCSLLTTSLLTVLTAHHSPYSLLATPYSLPTTHHSPLTTHHSHHSPLTTHHSLHRWDALDGAYASECVPKGMEGLGLRAVSTAGVEQLETAWRQRNESRGSELAAAGTEWSAAAALPAAAPSLVRARVGVGDASAAQQGDDVALVKLPSVTSTPIGVAAEQPRNSSPSPERLWSSLRSVIVGPSRNSTRNSTRNLSPELSSPRRQRTISSTDFKVPRGVQVVS